MRAPFTLGGWNNRCCEARSSGGGEEEHRVFDVMTAPIVSVGAASRSVRQRVDQHYETTSRKEMQCSPARSRT